MRTGAAEATLPAVRDDAIKDVLRVDDREALARAVLHESANLLHVIEMTGDLERFFTDDLPPALERMLSSLRLAARRAHDRLSALQLIFGATSNAPTDRAPISETALEVIRELTPRAHKRGVAIRADSMPDARVPRSMLALVLRNLIENGIKFAASEVEVSAAPTETGWRICVSDDGPGVPEDERTEIFAWRERGSAKEPGNGLGLTIARLAAERIGDEGLRLEPGRPTRFTLHVRSCDMPPAPGPSSA